VQCRLSRPAGYRSPGWELSPETLAMLAGLGFSYDRKAALDPADVATPSRRRMLTFGIAHERTQTEYWQSLLNPS